MQGRKIGVISHVAEMMERIPAQVQVVKTGSGSCCKNGIASLSQLYSTLWLTGAKNSVSGKDVKK